MNAEICLRSSSGAWMVWDVTVQQDDGSCFVSWVHDFHFFISLWVLVVFFGSWIGRAMMHIASVRANRYFFQAILGSAERIDSIFFLASLHTLFQSSNSCRSKSYRMYYLVLVWIHLGSCGSYRG
jgi:hypothetical protein